MNVQEGQNVTIAVCNVDLEGAHGFQIDNYFDSRTISQAPGQVLTVSFVANKVGTFRIYCNIFCAIHWAMQSGELVVALKVVNDLALQITRDSGRTSCISTPLQTQSRL